MKRPALPILQSGSPPGGGSNSSATQGESVSRRYSILDNVLGPVGRGPSSSHTMAPHRAALEAFSKLGGPPDFALITFLNSFATTGKGHRSHTALAAGLLGLTPEDERFPRAVEVAQEAGVEILFEHKIDDGEHPNTIYMELRRGETTLNMKVLSTGGGNYSIIYGDLADQPIRLEGDDGPSVLTVTDLKMLKALPALERALELRRPSWRDYSRLADESGLDCAEFSLLLETYIQISKGGLQTPAHVWSTVHDVLRIMLDAVTAGSEVRQQTQVTSGDWGHLLFQADSLLGNLWYTFAGAIAAQEYNAGMGVVAAAPTGGAAGTVPGVLYGMMRATGAPPERMVEALLVAGLVGHVAFTRGPVSGAQSGCGGEVGIAAMMAAGAASHLLGGEWEQVSAAAALVGQLFVGLECAPAKGNVEYPCIPRNGFAALAAVAAAEAAAAGIRPPHYGLDETLDRIFAVGRLLPQELREYEDGHWAESLVRPECCGKGGCPSCPVAA